MGCGSSKEQLDYEYYEMPRTNHGDPYLGRSQFPHVIAQGIVDKAPAPSSNNPLGRRPHAHYDREGDFLEERKHLKPLDGVPKHGKKDRPVLWAYPAEDFNYAGQNRHGRVGQGDGEAPTPHRIITDRNKVIQGMVTHPAGDLRRFERAPKRVDQYHVRRDRVRK